MLNDLYDKYADQGLAILAFPNNQFLGQEPASDDEILNCLAAVRPGEGFKPRFPIFAKLEVNGKREDLLFAWLKSACGSPPYLSLNFAAISWSPVKATDLQWNFEKFLIDKDGVPCRRYAPELAAEELTEDIERLLAGGACPKPSQNECVASSAIKGSR